MKKVPLIISLAIGIGVLGAPSTPNPDPERFRGAFSNFKREDAHEKTGKNLFLFTGSSSIRMWKSLAEDFPEQKTLNRGFGGSHLSDLLHYFDLLFARHKPAAIVLYCGENDLWSGKSPQQVFKDFKTFVDQVGQILPQTRIHYLACKPSPKRFEKWAIYQECNRMIAKHCASGERLNFVDVSKVMLDRKGRPLPDIWMKDKLHMNAKGYELWTQLLGPLLSQRIE